MSATPSHRQRPRTHTGEQAAEIAIFEATERLLGDHALHELSVAQIIQAAGLSRASFYHYFSSKFEVVAALFGRIFDEIYSETHDALAAEWDDSGRALRDSLKFALDSWHVHRAVIHALLENMHAEPVLATSWSTLKGRFVDVLGEHIKRDRAAGRAPDGLPPEVVATMMVCGAERIFYVGSTGGDPSLQTADQQLDAIVAISLAAIYGRAAGPALAT